MSRLTSLLLRLFWALHPHNIPLGLAAEIFVNVGVAILFVVALFLSLRLVRGRHPRMGWSRAFSFAVYGLVVALVCVIPALVTSVVLEFYSGPKAEGVRSAAVIQKVGALVYALGAVGPAFVVGGSEAMGWMRGDSRRVDGFGTGSWGAKVGLVLVPAILLSLGAGVRAAAAWAPPSPIGATEPWYLSKASFYCFDFGVEAGVVWVWLLARIDQRFYVPDGAKGRYGVGEASRPVSQRLLTFEAILDERLKRAEEEGYDALGVLGEISVPSSEKMSGEESRRAWSDTTARTVSGERKSGMLCMAGPAKGGERSKCALCSVLYDLNRPT